jgi:hypothetical protein
VLVSHQLNQIRRLCHRAVWIDNGGVRQDGPTHKVVSAYESAMLSGDRSQCLQRGGGTRARFLRWEIAAAPAGQQHVLSTLGPVTVNFTVELAEQVTGGEHGVALFNTERQLMWARAQKLALRPGTHVLSYSFPTLPLRPGAYQWQVSLWDNDEMLDLWDCAPEMNIATEIQQHYMDEWNGILNLQSEFSLGNDRKSDRDTANRI